MHYPAGDRKRVPLVRIANGRTVGGGTREGDGKVGAVETVLVIELDVINKTKKTGIIYRAWRWRGEITIA